MHSSEHFSLWRMHRAQQQGYDEDIDPHTLSDGGRAFPANKAATCQRDYEKRKKCVGCCYNYSSGKQQIENRMPSWRYHSQKWNSQCLDQKNVVCGRWTLSRCLARRNKVNVCQGSWFIRVAQSNPGEERGFVYPDCSRFFHMSDTCGAARKGQRLFAKTVIDMWREKGITDEKDLVIYIVNC